MNKIFILSPLPPPVHGMSLASKILIDELKSSKEWDCHFFDTSNSPNIESSKKQGKFNLFKIISSLRNFSICLFKMILFRPNIVYIAIPQSFLGFVSYLPYLILSKLILSRVILHFHGANYTSLFSSKVIGFLLIKIVKMTVDNIIVLGYSLKKGLLLYFDDDFISVCENGVNNRLVERRKYNKVGKINLLYFSNLMISKGVLVFLDALIEHKDICDKFNITICGGFDDNCDEILERLNKVDSFVNYRGPLYGLDKSQEFENADVFILPSYNEGQPLSILEAYMHGCCVISTIVGGIGDIFVDKVNGYEIKVGSVESIYDCLINLNKNDLAAFGAYNEILANDIFTEKAFSNRVIEIFNKV